MDTNRGLYDKFCVTRTDGRSEPGEKHEDCEYFVLDLTHDPFALAALEAYQEASAPHRSPGLPYDDFRLLIGMQRARQLKLQLELDKLNRAAEKRERAALAKLRGGVGTPWSYRLSADARALALRGAFSSRPRRT